MKTKFTKGEWVIKPTEDNKEYIRIRGSVLGGKFKIANVSDLKSHHDDKYLWCKRDRAESLANAHLIAAAPEMYEALYGLYYGAAITGDDSEWVDDVGAILAKARGES